MREVPVARSDREIADLLDRGVAKILRPTPGGLFDNFLDLESLWRRAFADLGLQPQQLGRPVLVTEPPLSSTVQREMMTQVLFEDFGATAVHFAVSGALSLSANGDRTGLVVEIGGAVSQFVPVYEGFALPHAVRRLDIGGRTITDRLFDLIMGQQIARAPNQYGSPQAVRHACCSFKEQHCYVAQDFAQEFAQGCAGTGARWIEIPPERTMKLPDGTEIQVGTARFQAPEVLFDPASIGLEAGGVHDVAWDTMQACDVDVRQGLASNIVLAGGTMCMQGIQRRMQKEMRDLVPGRSLVKVVQSEAPRHSAFLGGSIVADLANMRQKWFTEQEYFEQGVSAVHARCVSL
uniref:Actin n=1 Tax=Zooxanthella nutricula TaxID=1333877 RepID=A0A7S2PTP7_9DINO